jgi:hypothetical protein
VFALASASLAQQYVALSDEFDDKAIARQASERSDVRYAGRELDDFSHRIAAKQQQHIERLLGKPSGMQAKTYAMPVAQQRVLMISGIRMADKTMNKNHTDFYPVGDIGGVAVWYGIDGKSPEAVVVYLKVDKSFPKLSEKNLKERLVWDADRLTKLFKAVEERQRKN